MIENIHTIEKVTQKLFKSTFFKICVVQFEVLRCYNNAVIHKGGKNEYR